jgi:21S rRNA (GM2251-2'-O)-methyltransferase
MLFRLFRINFSRYLHNKTPLPELDFTKPTSDRLKKSASKKESFSNDHSILKIPLRGQCLFGLYPVELALQAKRRQFYRLFFSETSNDNRQLIQNIQNLAKELSIPIEYTNTKTLDCLSFDRPHQGVCLDCSSLPIEDIEQIEMKTNPKNLSLDLCLVKIFDPMNLGAMIRTAYFFGIDRTILTRGTCQPSPVASKASSGALELTSIYSCRDLKHYLEVLHEQKNTVIICATHHGKLPLHTLSLNDIKQRFSNLKRIILLIGNEHEGIEEEISQLCHYNVSIQSNNESQISSLNASVACALFLYHISAQMNI